MINTLPFTAPSIRRVTLSIRVTFPHGWAFRFLHLQVQMILAALPPVSWAQIARSDSLLHLLIDFVNYTLKCRCAGSILRASLDDYVWVAAKMQMHEQTN